MFKSKFKKSKIFLSSLAIGTTIFSSSAYAQSVVYTVKPGDSMWKIATKYQVGISELIAANPSIKNPNLIYPNQKITIPTIDDVKAFEKEVIRLTNVQRSKYGLKPLSENWELSRVARFKSQDMIDKKYFDHTSPTYGSPFTMMKNFGIRYTAAGENIAYGQKTPQEVVNGWMNSSGHRANILNANFTQIGVGFAKNSNGTPYWTQTK
ncbi:SafA/ExsA family spore coat assembly protein [Clostridium sp.]|jgi:uncharacterized YkwD family protein/spore coat assembly protein SafA|uniref:SafA/ExsA family spore coat assembly protein n=1 Tax=Clostridium sp. TaxID=1506 RepID=UPI0039F4BE35